MASSEMQQEIDAFLRKISAKGESTCHAALEELKRNPEIAAAIRHVEYDVLTDVALLRAPVLAPYSMTKVVADQALAKLNKGDVAGAVSNYSAAIAVGILSAVPVIPLGDAAIELMRAGGVDIERSPLRKAYDTVTGTDNACGNMHKFVQSQASSLTATQRNEILRKVTPLTGEQAESVSRIVHRVAQAYMEIKTSQSGHELLASPKADRGLAAVRR